MFKISHNATYFWPVTVELPADGGKFEKHTFDAQFKRLPQKRLDEIFDRNAEVKDSDVITEILVGWKGIVDDQGNEVVYSETNRDELLQIARVRSGILAAFLESLAGAKRKN